MIRLGILILATTSLAHAQPPAEVTVDQAVALVQASPRLAAERADIGVAAADVIEARQHPNPTLDVSGTRTVAGSDTIAGWQPSVGVDVPILIGHQRARRGEAARDRVAAVRAELAATTGDAELDVRARFAALLVAQEQEAVLAAALADARAVREIVAARSAAGAGSPYAVERVDLEIAELASRVDEAASARAAAAGDLASAVGIPGWHPHALGVLEDPIALGALDEAHPRLAADRAAHESALADIAVARADATPTPSFGLHAFTTSDPTSLVIAAGVSIPLPVFDRNRGAIARARATADRADLVATADRVALTTAVDRASTVLAARREGTQRFQADALQRLAKLRTMAETSYRSGQGGVVELLDALGAITDARLRDLDLRAGLAEAALELRRAQRGR